MSSSSQIALGALRLEAQYRADMENNPAISDQEWNSYANRSYKELYDLLVSAYGNEYEFAAAYQFTTGNSQFYPLPDGTPNFQDVNGNTAVKFYKLSGVDLQYSASPTGWITLRNFEFIQRNRFYPPNTAGTWSGQTNLRYRVQGDNLFLIPTPQTGQLVQIWYAPAPTSLIFSPPSQTTISSTTVSLPDVTGLSVGMNVTGPGIQNSATISTINSTTNQISLSSAATLTQTNAILQIWSDGAMVEGLSGWEEYIIIDMAIKAGIKQENDVTELKVQKADMRARIEAMAEGRDQGQAHHVSDSVAVNAYAYDGYCGLGFEEW